MKYSQLIASWAEDAALEHEDRIRSLQHNCPRRTYEQGFEKATQLITRKFNELLHEKSIGDAIMELNNFLSDLQQ